LTKDVHYYDVDCMKNLSLGRICW